MRSMGIIFLILAFFLSGLWETEAIIVIGRVGQNIKITCSHSNAKTNVKYFCKDPCKSNEDVLIRSNNNDLNGKYSIRDEGNTFYVTISHLTKNDSGTYWCGIERFILNTYNKVNLRVTKEKPEPENHTNYYLIVFLPVVLCAAAMLGLLLAAKHWGSGRCLNREASSDSETIMPGVESEPELHSVSPAPDSSDVSASPPPPPPPPRDRYAHVTAKNRKSTVSLDLAEYVEMSTPVNICHYQHLDLSQLEAHVYHSLHGNRGPSEGLRSDKLTVSGQVQAP